MQPTPYTLHPAPVQQYTALHPTPYVLHPTSYTPHPNPHTLHPAPYTPTPYTLRLTPCVDACSSASDAVSRSTSSAPCFPCPPKPRQDIQRGPSFPRAVACARALSLVCADLGGGVVEQELDSVALFGQFGQLLALLLARVPGRRDLRLQ